MATSNYSQAIKEIEKDLEKYKDMLQYAHKDDISESLEESSRSNSLSSLILWVGVIILPVTFIFLAIAFTDTLFDFAMYGILLDIVITPIALIIAWAK